MDHHAARELVLVASLEEADGEAEIVSAAARARATEGAPDPGSRHASADGPWTAAEESFLNARAAALFSDLAEGEPWLEKSAAAAAGSRFAGPLLVALAFLLGFLSKELGPSGVVNILAFPLLGVMLWNVGVYLFTGVAKLSGRRRLGVAASSASAWLDRRLASLGDRGGVRGRGLSLFASRWCTLARPVLAARVAHWLHLAAAGLAAGAVLAMYWQGVIRDYQATWESTFLSAEGVRGVLAVALAPAAWVPGLGLPDASAIEAIRAPAGEGAAVWIHRYAVAAGVVVVLPRLALAVLAAARARAAANQLDIAGVAPGYFRALLDEKRGVKSVARVLPHRVDLEPKDRDALRAALHRHWGGALWVEFLEPVMYGDEEAFAERAAELEGGDYVALAAGFASTPEEESQGRLLRAVAAALGGEGRALLHLDAAGFRERFGAARFEERRTAWERLADASGFELLIDEG